MEPGTITNMLMKIDNRMKAESDSELLMQARAILVAQDHEIQNLLDQPQDIKSLQERLATVMTQIENLRVQETAFEDCKAMAVERELKIPADIETIPALMECIFDQVQRKAGRRKNKKNEGDSPSGESDNPESIDLERP